MYIPRLLQTTLNSAINSFPAVLVTGPRQSGKTTLLQHALAAQQFAYVSFDDPLERDFARQDPQGFLNRFGDKQPVILDEIQYLPELLPYLKMRIDGDRQNNGRWLLTGSQQLQLMQNVSESLAGRIAILELLPFSSLELKSQPSRKNTNNDLAALWYSFYPEPALNFEKRELWLRSYIQTYIERDLRQLQHIQDLGAFERFVALTAARHTQLFNHTELGREVGVTTPTIKSWGTLLEAAYICYFLPPYFKNYGKRLTKAPKVYFIDAAIVAFLTRQPNIDAMLAGPMAGAFFEGFIISEALKVFFGLGKKPDLFFWRSHDGLEVDLIIQINGKLHPVEIKFTTTPATQHLAPLNKFKELAGDDAVTEGILVCRIPQKMALPANNIALPWQEFSQWLLEKLQSLSS